MLMVNRSHVNMIEEPCEGKLQARFCEGKRINKCKRWIGEAELEDESIFIYPASYSTKFHSVPLRKINSLRSNSIFRLTLHCMKFFNAILLMREGRKAKTKRIWKREMLFYYGDAGEPADKDFLGAVALHNFDVTFCLVEVEQVAYKFFSVG